MGAEASAWGAAQAAADSAGVSLRALTTTADSVDVHALVSTVWGEEELRPSLAQAFQHAGCGVYGAADANGGLVGFVLGFLGWNDGIHMHSHMLAVLPEWRSRGVGYALKLAQRAACLEAGVDEARWTYDPLVARNAWFNLVKLGTVATAFFPGFYGEMTDRINKGDRSDRFEVRWRLRSDRAERAVSGTALPPQPGPVLLACVGAGDLLRPKETGAQPEPGAIVELPLDHAALRTRDASLGREWRETSARAFEACFEAGLAAAWIDRRGRYVFVPAKELME
jgi:predicted GNAT superfamily acetyltransferase